jgi:GT2 family glycosyltransferase
MEHYIRDQGFTGTGNMAVRRAVIDDVGPFGGIAIAEDRDWGQRATAKGYVIRWSPGMIAFHPARASFAELARKWDRSTAHDFRLKARGLSGRLTWIARAVVVALSPLAHAFRVVRSDRIIGGTAARAKAFAVLVRIRLYRARLMLALALAGSTKDIEGRWRDTRGTGG